MGRRAGMLAAVVALILGIGATSAHASTISVSDAGFGNFVVGSSGTLTVTVTADGISVAGISITGTNAADFAVVSDHCSGHGGAVTSCTFDVSFTPSARGPRTAIATVDSDATSGDNTSTLTGTGVAPVIQVPANLAFGNQPVGTTSPTQTLTVTNATTDAGQTLMISAVSLTGMNPSEFVISNNNCTSASVAPGSSCSLHVAFKPTALGVRNASVRVTSNAPSSGITDVPVSGTGTMPALSITPTAITFADRQVGTTSDTQSLTISSVGNADLVVGTLSVTGSDYSVASDTCTPLPVVVHPGDSCTLGLRFSPTAVGASAGNVHVSTNAGTQDVGLSGNGTAAPTTTTPTSTPDDGGTTTPPPTTDTPPASGDTQPTALPEAVSQPTAAECVVPTLKGKTLAAARRALQRAHCALGRVTKVRAKRGRGRVLRQGKRTGRHLPGGTLIAVALGRA